MKKTNIEADNAHLKSELSKSNKQNSYLKKENKNLSKKLEKSKNRATELKKELKKNDGWSVT